MTPAENTFTISYKPSEQYITIEAKTREEASKKFHEILPNVSNDNIILIRDNNFLQIEDDNDDMESAWGIGY
jgi:hypothetical protein